ncbi:MAG: heparinase II/III family protein [Verrucomicrobia bacterium]|nr:heparinase II/III family protein [Verrucomicrobiota bacterium]
MKRLPRTVPLLLLGVALFPARAADNTIYPPTTTEAEVRALVQPLELPRPRLLVRPGEWDRVRERVRREPGIAAIADRIRRDADAMLGIAPIKRELIGRRMLAQSRRALRRLLTLSFTFVLTRDSKYAERAAREMRAIADFPDWNPAHFLDVAEMTLAMAIGYDWLHGQLDEPTRAAVRATILTKGVRVPLDTQHNRWTVNASNWGQVCHAGMVAGALAVLEDDREAATLTIHRALANVPRAMAAFAPKGSYPEGPGYWSYGTTFNVILIALLENALGRSFGLDQAPGFDQTGAFLALATGPSGLTFNFADGSSGRWVEPAVHWFAARYRRPEWLLGEAAAVRRELAAPGNAASPGNRFLPFMLLWAQDDTGADYTRLPLHWTGDGAAPIALHRSSWTDPNAVFVGLKAGSPSGPHGQMDIGSFVLDADGQRWAVDLGAEDYQLVEDHKATRWVVFRQNSFGHNTLVIGDALQVVTGRSHIVRFSTDPAFPHSVVDMSPVYAGQAATVHRGIALLPDGRVFVRDHLAGLKPGVAVRWGMVTTARPGEVGSDSLELHQHKATARLRIHEPAGAVWALVDTAKSRNPWDSPNPGTVMAAFTVQAPASGTLDLGVVFSPGSRDGVTASPLPPEPPLYWSSPR